MAKRSSQSDHDAMVLYAARSLVNKNYRNVKADIPDWSSPDKIIWSSTGQGHIPDVTGDGIIVEVETSDSIYDSHTEDQWKLFSAHALQYSKAFWILVPAANSNSAQQRRDQLGITATIWSF